MPGWDPGRRALDETIGSDRLIALTRADEGRRYFSLDGLRSVVNLTDDQGNEVASYHLDAWGNFRFPSELTNSANRFAFTGHIFDTETGLYNAKARYFDPKLGRFLTQDSYLGQIDEPPSLHRYLYANANPTVFVDPTGHASFRQWIGLDKPTDSMWGNFTRDFGYNLFNAVSLGTLARQDTLVEQYERGQIGEGGYWLKTGGNAATGAATLAVATVTGGAAAGVASGLGAGTVLAGAVGGGVAGVAAQATTDISEVGFLGTKSASDVHARDYLLAGAFGAVTGGAVGKLAPMARDTSLTLNRLSALDNPVTSRLAQGLESLGHSAYNRGNASVRVESLSGDSAAPTPGQRANTGSQPVMQSATVEPPVNIAARRPGVAAAVRTGGRGSGAGFTKADIVEGLRGTTAQADRIATAIREGKAGVNILGDELMDRYFGTDIAYATGKQMYLRSSSRTYLTDAVHEGTHVLDYSGGFGRSPLRSGWSWENRAFFYERQFQLWTNRPPDFGTVSDMLAHVRRSYSGGLYDPY